MEDLSALILTYNERENIGRTLTALRWIPEVVLLDSFSSDDTIALAKAAHAGVKVVQRRFDSFAGQCNFGLTEIKTEWVLSIDADYVITNELQDEIRSLIPPEEVGLTGLPPPWNTSTRNT